MASIQTAYARREAMGTYFEVFLAGEDEEHLHAVAAAVLDEVIRIERLLSRYDPASEITRINREAPHRWVRVDTEIWAILCACRDWRRRTDGYFDVTAGSGREASDGPAESLLLDEGRRVVRLVQPGVAIDLGGFGKGYVLDRAAAILRQFGVTSGLVHGGTSSIVAVGRHPNGQSWPVAIRDPFGDDGSPPIGQVLLLADNGFSCSAVFAPGQSASDIIDPHRGQPLTAPAACLVITPTALEAEVLSTAFLSMEKARTRAYLNTILSPEVSVGWIDRVAGRPQFEWLKEMP